MPEERKASELELEAHLLLADSIVAATPNEDIRRLLCAVSCSIWGPHVTDAIASLNARIRELERLRDQVRKAQL